MARTVGIGHQDFEKIRARNIFYVDKTALTNKEVRIMFENMVRDWFSERKGSYNEFMEALLEDTVQEALKQIEEKNTGRNCRRREYRKNGYGNTGLHLKEKQF